jgi:outer membrane protein assembly factor BamA
MPFAGIFGSHYKFIRITLDVRQYFSLWETHVLAYQIYANVITGHPPFYKMSLFGGSNIMRGYYEGRYRDRDMLAFQAEYRLPVWWRFGIVGFAGYGDVAHRLSDFRIKDFKYSIGYGIRFGIDQQNRLNIRLDIGYGKKSAYPVIAFQEAF